MKYLIPILLLMGCSKESNPIFPSFSLKYSIISLDCSIYLYEEHKTIGNDKYINKIKKTLGIKKITYALHSAYWDQRMYQCINQKMKEL